MTTYALGATARLKGTFRNEANNPADPSGVFLRLLPPSGVIAVHEYGDDATIFRQSTGVYSADIVLNQEGRWRYRWEAAGTNVTAAEGVMDVDATEFA
jgi:hypothetical protein